MAVLNFILSAKATIILGAILGAIPGLGLLVKYNSKDDD